MFTKQHYKVIADAIKRSTIGRGDQIHGTAVKPWRLDKWNESFCHLSGLPKLAMTKKEIDESVKFLRDHMYPKPEDCPSLDCPKLRPACHPGICQIAVGMCGDF